MEALKRLFKAKAEFVSSSEHDGNPPTDEQLACFLRNLTAETGLAIRGAPQAVGLLFIFISYEYSSTRVPGIQIWYHTAVYHRRVPLLYCFIIL